MADVSVRPARTGDAAEIARIQLETWRIAYASILPAPVLDALDAGDATASWTTAIEAAPTPRHRVLVALERDQLVGFIAIATPEDLPAGEPDLAATVAFGPLLVEPRWGRRGHGSRLLAAAVDTARTTGATRAVAWLPEADDASRAFFGSAGWAGDGYVRGLETGAGQVREVRIQTSLATD
ncbi:MAG TPA: GNAT family N-acetyltransferase [Jatrophihabitantaceae bacterium]|jgi:GNAT superfamily N-acetyltransferase|nr:GNAT family N-acetyltransferase [Jatrophihabitantaceae bacterium]